MVNPKSISLVIPAFNEEKNILHLYNLLRKVIEKNKYYYEIIFVDDGSTDNTLRVLKSIHKKDKKVKIISFRKNFGQTAALSSGFDYARKSIVITLDADLQNDPRDIPTLLREIDKGYDVVSGWRVNRKDDFLTRNFPSYFANWLISKISGIKLHDYGCTLKAYKKDILEDIKLYGEMHRFIPAIAASVGARVGEVEISHHRRRYGKSKYGIDRTLRVILDLLVIKFILSYQFRPIQLFGKLGFAIIAFGSLIFIWLVYGRFFLAQPLSTRPLLVVSIFFILVGIQFIIFGLLAEIMVRIYFESQKKPTYFIKKIVK